MCCRRPYQCPVVGQYTAVMLFTMIDAVKSGIHFYLYLGVVEVLLTLLIVWYALTWPTHPLEPLPSS